ncbi:hypothetical protein V1522DRAFT_394932 [Lipomyces starkeyi]
MTNTGVQEDEEPQLVEILLTDKLLRYATQPGGYERSLRRFRAKFGNVESMKPLTAFDFTNTATANVNLSEEDRNENERESEPRETEDEANLGHNADGDTATISEGCHESTDHVPESPVGIRALLRSGSWNG